MSILLQTLNLKAFYEGFLSKKKERFEVILEPLQCVLQFAFLAFCPIGTKIHIENNLLKIQLPNYSQGFIRWYHNDNHDDIFYLFYVCKRFSKFYKHLKEIKNENTSLYYLLVTLSKKGISNLIKTYSKIEKISLLHTLELYKVLLENPKSLKLSGGENDEKQNIDSLFININKLYSIEELNIIFNTLLMLEKTNDINYIIGLNKLIKPTTNKINKWINDNIIF
jgi:hypothetical protein